MKRIAEINELNIICHSPLPKEVNEERDRLYTELSDIEFMKKYRKHIFSPALIEFPNEKYEIQLNFCNSTFCKNYRLPQLKYDSISGKPSRYKMNQNSIGDVGLYCNDIPSEDTNKVNLNNISTVISNWSVSEEIKRLININSVVPIEPEYVFHKEGCINIDKVQYKDKDTFRKRGYSTSNSTKYECKQCGKLTNVLPECRTAKYSLNKLQS